CQHGYVTPFTC
nr:immunoglobulin light chain junction region [Macaca mulatta]